MNDTLELHVDIGEDWVAQIFWSDEYNDPITAAEPILADVKDANGQIAIRFVSASDPQTEPHIQSSGFSGFFQLSIPKEWTVKLVPGRYLFDLFSGVADSSPPFQDQQQKVCEGFLVAHSRTTVLESVNLIQDVAP